MTATKFIPKIHIACAKDELRQSLAHVLLTKEFIVASDALIMVEIPTSDIFPYWFIEKLPERCLIHRLLWEQLVKADRVIDFKDDIIFYSISGVTFCLKVKSEDDFKFPNYEHLMQPKKCDVGKIHIDPSLLKRIQDCIHVNRQKYRTLILEFSGSAGGILVYAPDSDNHAKAILMPKMLNE